MKLNNLVLFLVIIFGSNLLFGQGTAIDTVWTTTLGSDHNEYPIEIRKTQDDGYILAALQTDFNPAISDVWISKLDSNGIEEWSSVLNFTAPIDLSDMEILPDKSIILTGKLKVSQGSLWIAKLDSSANQVWSNTYFDSTGAMGNDIEVLSENSFLITGTKQDSVFLVKVSSNGVVIWNHTYSYFNHLGAEGNAVGILSNGSIIIGADIIDIDDDLIYARAGLYLVDTLGIFQSLNIYVDPNSITNTVNDMEVTPQDEILILGFTFVPGNYDDAYVKCIDPSGNEIWMQTYGSWNLEEAYDLYVEDSGDFLVCGFTKGFGIPNNRDYWIFRCDPSGNLIWNYWYGGNPWEIAYSVIPAKENEYVYAGSLPGQGQYGTQIFIAKIMETPVAINDRMTSPKTFRLYQNYPNPFNPKTTIQYDLPNSEFVTLSIYDVLGRKIKDLIKERQAAGSYQIQFESEDLSSGIYIYKITAGSHIGSEKMMVLK